jgi:hypothetical protein
MLLRICSLRMVLGDFGACLLVVTNPSSPMKAGLSLFQETLTMTLRIVHVRPRQEAGLIFTRSEVN